MHNRFSLGHSFWGRILLIGAVSLAPLAAGAQPLPVIDGVPAPLVTQSCGTTIRTATMVGHPAVTQTQIFESMPEDTFVGRDLSFMNTSDTVMDRVVIRIGSVDYTKGGTFAPKSMVSWRVMGPPGICAIREIHFVDGSDWQATTV